MDKRDIAKSRLKKGDFLFQQNTDCDCQSVFEWIKCIDEEKGALICNTIRNNAYDDCRI